MEKRFLELCHHEFSFLIKFDKFFLNFLYFPVEAEKILMFGRKLHSFKSSSLAWKETKFLLGLKPIVFLTKIGFKPN